LPALPPDLLTEEQKSLAADMKEGTARCFQGFVNVRDDGALLGPWNP
jgi:4-carboxymuconolactone decarboxylase